MPDIFDFFFGDGRGQQRQIQTQPRVGFGSGVIISKDGYIVTNNHVVEGADEITVKLNDDRELKGRIIGTDPSTDLALIKIEGDDFPTVPVGNSDELKVGEWVLAVGNPFNPELYRYGRYRQRKGSCYRRYRIQRTGCEYPVFHPDGCRYQPG